MMGSINSFSNGYNSTSLNFVGNSILFVIDNFGIKPLFEISFACTGDPF